MLSTEEGVQNTHYIHFLPTGLCLLSCGSCSNFVTSNLTVSVIATPHCQFDEIWNYLGDRLMHLSLREFPKSLPKEEWSILHVDWHYLIDWGLDLIKRGTGKGYMTTSILLPLLPDGTRYEQIPATVISPHDGLCLLHPEPNWTLPTLNCFFSDIWSQQGNESGSVLGQD